MKAQSSMATAASDGHEVCRVHIDPQPTSGAWNMAVDEALLKAAVESGCCSLRLYRWSEPTVSLGYFQPSDALSSIPSLAGLPAVRRLSGGGAILHHHELTYSCAVPAQHPLTRIPSGLYQAVHAAVIQILSQMGFPLQMRGETVRTRREPFLCFGRGDRNDVLLDGHKVLGSAQRRRRGSVLQHGSLLLKRSPLAPEYAGLLDLRPDAETTARLAEDLADAIGTLFGREFVYGPLGKATQELAAQLETNKYGSLDWQRRGQLAACAD